MWLEAIITREDLAQVLGELLPVKLNLSDDGSTERWLLLGRAAEVTLVEDEGLHVLCPAKVCWSIAGVSPAVTLNQLAVMIRPEMVEKDGRYVLEFQLEIEQVDVDGLPSFLDASVVKAVNSALSSKPLLWDFTKTLTFRLHMPAMFQPQQGLNIDVRWGKRRISAEALVLAVSFHIGFTREEVASSAQHDDEALLADRIQAVGERKAEKAEAAAAVTETPAAA